MGGGSWTTASYTSYSKAVGASVCADGSRGVRSVQETFKASSMDKMLNPYQVIRECCDSDEHPNTMPVILALDVTGSMGKAAARVAEQLNPIMTELYKNVTDVQFMIMGIGDFAYDCSPLQVSQFESDIRIAEQLDKLWFEAGGGGNSFESYTAAWYFGLNHCKLDCWNRHQKGIIITLGDEQLNPYISDYKVKEHIGDNLQDDVNTQELYADVIKKFDVYHISVSDIETNYGRHLSEYTTEYRKSVDDSWIKVIGQDNYKVATLDSLKQTIVDIIIQPRENVISNNTNEISW